MATRSSPSVIITPYRFNISTGFSKPLSPLPAATTVIDITRDSDSDTPPVIPGTHTQSPAAVPGSITCVPVQPRKRSREIRSPGGSPTSAAEYLSSAASTSTFAFPLVPGGGDSTASSSAKRRPTKTQKVDNSSHVLDMGGREHYQQQQRQRQRNHHRSSSSSRPSTPNTSSSSSFEHSHTSSTPAAPRRLKRENAIIFPNTGSSSTSATATSSSSTRTTAGYSSSRTPTPSTLTSLASTSTSTSTYEYSIPNPTWMETYMRSRFGGDSDFLFMDIDTSPCVPPDVEVDADGDADTEMDVDLDSGSSFPTAATLSYIREQDAHHRGRQRNKRTETQTEIETPAASQPIPIQLHTMTTCAKARRKIAKERWNAERARLEKARLEELKGLRLREEEELRLRKEAEEKEREEMEKMEKMKEALKDKKEAAKYRDEMMARAARAREERMKQEQQQQQQEGEGELGAYELGSSCLPDQIQASTAPRSLRRSYALYGPDEFKSGSSKILDTPPARTRPRTRVHSSSSRPRQPSPPPLSNVPITLLTRGRQPRAQSSSPPEPFLYDFPVATPSLSPSPPPPPPPEVQFQSKRSPLVPDEFRESVRHVVPDDVLPEAVREWKRMTPRIPSGTVPSSYSTKVGVCESERKSRCEERNGVSSGEEKGKLKKVESKKKKKAVSDTRWAAMVWAVESLFGRKEWLRMCVEAEEKEKEHEGVKVQQLTKKATVKPKKSRPEPEALTPLWKCKQVFRVGPRAAFLHQVVEWEMLFAGVDGGGEDREEMEREMFGNRAADNRAQAAAAAARSPQEVAAAVGGTCVPVPPAAATGGVMDATRELEMLVDDIERAQDELEIDDDVEMFEVAEGCGLDLGHGLGGADEGEEARDIGRELQVELERELGLACEDEMGFGMLGGERDAPGEVDDSFVVVSPSMQVPGFLLPAEVSSLKSQPVPIHVPLASSSPSSASSSTRSSTSKYYISPSLLSVSPRSPPAPPLSCSPPGKSKAAMPVMTMTTPAWVVIAKDRTRMDGGTLEGEVKSPVPVHKGAASGSSAGVEVKPEEKKEANCGSKMKTGGKFGLGLGLGLSFGVGGGGGGRARRPGSAWRATRSEKEDVVFGTSGTGSSASWEMVY